MISDFIGGVGKGLLVLVILTFVAILGYATSSVLGYVTSSIIEINPQVTSAGFVAVALVSGIVSVIHGR